MTSQRSSVTGTLAVMGGAFDPVHYGHLRTAVELIERLEFDELRFIPSANPPHRERHIAIATDRVRMLRAAIQGLPLCKIDEREINRQGPSWSVLTLEELRAEQPDRSLCMVTGMDAFLGLPDWHRWQDIFELAHVVVAWRPGFELPVDGVLGELLKERLSSRAADLHESLAGRIFVADVTQLEISSSAIRARLQASASVDFLLPPAVLDVIREVRCYPLISENVPKEQSLHAK